MTGPCRNDRPGGLHAGRLPGPARSKIPAPVEGEAERVALWVQTLTGMELDSNDAARALDASAWQARLRDLRQSGGPPVSPEPEERAGDPLPR
jgi:hypothetical protein